MKGKTQSRMYKQNYLWYKMEEMRKQYNGGCIMIMLKFVLGNFNGKYRRKHKKNRTCLNDNKQSGAYVALET
jgi:hypothetical protein